MAPTITFIMLFITSQVGIIKGCGQHLHYRLSKFPYLYYVSDGVQICKSHTAWGPYSSSQDK